MIETPKIPEKHLLENPNSKERVIVEDFVEDLRPPEFNHVQVLDHLDKVGSSRQKTYSDDVVGVLYHVTVFTEGVSVEKEKKSLPDTEEEIEPVKSFGRK